MKQKKNIRAYIVLAVLLWAMIDAMLVPIGSSNPEQERITGTGWVITGERGKRPHFFDRCDATDSTVYFSYDYEDCIDAYSIDGEFLYTIHIASLIEKGSLEIGCTEDLLIAQANEGTVYLFRGTEFLERMDREEARERGYDLSTGYESNYGVTREAVIRMEGEKQIELFPLPEEIRANWPLIDFGKTGNRIVEGIVIVLFFGMGISMILDDRRTRKGTR